MSLGARLFLLFTIVPLVEIYLLMKLHPLMGAEATIALVVLTGLVGAALARREGARVLQNWRESMAQGQVPRDGVLSAALVLVGGVLLVTPGVLTDATGILLLIPPSRRLIARGLKRYLERRVQVTHLSPMGPHMGPDLGPPGPGPQVPRRPRRQGDVGSPVGAVIDVETVPAEPIERV